MRMPAYLVNLETAVRDAKLAQDLELESLCSGAGHSQVVKDRPTANDSGSRDCVKLASPTAVSRVKYHLLCFFVVLNLIVYTLTYFLSRKVVGIKDFSVSKIAN